MANVQFFQNNEPISIYVVDAMVASFYNKPVDKNYYATPFSEKFISELGLTNEIVFRQNLNWFEVIMTRKGDNYEDKIKEVEKSLDDDQLIDLYKETIKMLINNNISFVTSY